MSPRVALGQGLDSPDGPGIGRHLCDRVLCSNYSFQPPTTSKLLHLIFLADESCILFLKETTTNFLNRKFKNRCAEMISLYVMISMLSRSYCQSQMKITQVHFERKLAKLQSSQEHGLQCETGLSNELFVPGQSPHFSEPRETCNCWEVGTLILTRSETVTE